MTYIPVPGGTSQADQKRIKRLQYSLASINAKTYTLDKQYKVMEKDRQAKCSWTLPIITGQAITSFDDCKNTVYTHNISLQDSKTGNVFLQHFCPATESAASSMTKSYSKGATLFRKVMETAKCKKHKADTRQTVDQQQHFPHYHFGIWYDKMMVSLTLLEETQQPGREEGRQAVAEFCIWFKEFTRKFVLPIIKNGHSGLCDTFRSELQERMDVHFPWAEKQVDDLDRYCHPLYSTISPFLGFSSNVHKDVKDADVSILVNLGQHALLQLPEYGIAVELQPQDIVMFLSNSVEHLTVQHPAHVKARSDPGERMAISCFFRKGLQQQREPKKHNHTYYARKAEEEQEAERQAASKKRRVEQCGEAGGLASGAVKKSPE
ncbi:uncharacterized protein UTRI_00930 [Ustilago trichophora]|uniref:Uncharacterized protein n=1 Tax=Ustilago trichophora TaxID=86804 RepID=A0A5C3DVF5_9BASI|nr:uncharacterized protein UTRI_00930 [Ustilago trichophora]